MCSLFILLQSPGVYVALHVQVNAPNLIISFLISRSGMAAEIWPLDWLRSQVLLLPHVSGRCLHGVETVLHSRSFKQVRQKLDIKNPATGIKSDDRKAWSVYSISLFQSALFCFHAIN